MNGKRFAWQVIYFIVDFLDMVSLLLRHFMELFLYCVTWRVLQSCLSLMRDVCLLR